MAIDVLRKEVKHSFIHDTESMVYILIFISCHQGGPHLAEREDKRSFKDTALGHWCPIEDVDEDRLRVIGDSKENVMNSELRFYKDVIGSMHKYFEPLCKCFRLLRRVLFPPPEWPDLDSTPASVMPIPSADEIDLRSVNMLKEVKKVVRSSLTELEKEEARAKIESSGVTTAEQGGETHTESIQDGLQQQDTITSGDSSTIPRRNIGSDFSKTRDRAEILDMRLRDVMIAQDDLRRMATTLENPESLSTTPKPAPGPTHPQQTRITGASVPAHASTQSLGKRQREDTFPAVRTIPSAEFYRIDVEAVKRPKTAFSWEPPMQSLGE